MIAETSSAVAARMRGSSMINLPASLLKMARHDIEEQQLRLCGFSDYELALKKTGRRHQGRERAMKRHSHTFAAVGAIADCCVRPRSGIRSKIGRHTENTPWRQPGEHVDPRGGDPIDGNPDDGGLQQSRPSSISMCRKTL